MIGSNCPHSSRCPGCPFIDLSYEKQLERKTELLRAAVSPHPALSGVASGLGTTQPASPVEGYRTRLKWVAGPGGALGLFARGTHEVVDTPSCVVGHPLLLRIGATLRALLRSGAHPAIAKGLTAVDLRQIEAPRAGALVTLIVRTDVAPGSPALAAFANALVEEEADVLSVQWSGRSPGSPQLLGRDGGILFGPDRVVDRVGSVEVVATAGSFVQVHRGQAAVLEQMLVDGMVKLGARLGRPVRVLELFAGSGAFGLALAKAGANVVAVESFAPAARSIADAADRMGIQIAWQAADAEAFVRRRRSDIPEVDLVVVDPPRRGLPPRLRAGIAALSPQALVYVSCAPSTLARDLADFARLGLRTTQLTSLDMFPQTDHVEAIAWVEPGTPALLESIYEDDALVAFEKPPHESVNELSARVEASSGYHGAASITRLPTFVSGPVLFAKQGGDSAGLRLEILRTVRLRCVALLKGIASEKGSIARAVRGVGGPPTPGPSTRSSEPRDAQSAREVPVTSPPSRSRYKRVRIESGHSFVRLESAAELETAMTHVAMLGHPVVGDPKRCDEPTRRHFFEKHGLDRAYCWVESLSFELGGRRIEVGGAEPGDLRAVSASLSD